MDPKYAGTFKTLVFLRMPNVHGMGTSIGMIYSSFVHSRWWLYQVALSDASRVRMAPAQVSRQPNGVCDLTGMFRSRHHIIEVSVFTA